MCLFQRLLEFARNETKEKCKIAVNFFFLENPVLFGVDKDINIDSLRLNDT